MNHSLFFNKGNFYFNNIYAFFSGSINLQILQITKPLFFLVLNFYTDDNFH